MELHKLRPFTLLDKNRSDVPLHNKGNHPPWYKSSSVSTPEHTLVSRKRRSGHTMLITRVHGFNLKRQLLLLFYLDDVKIIKKMQLVVYFLQLYKVLVLQVDPTKLRQAVKTVLFNHFFISGPMVVAVYHLMSWRGDPCGPELPTFHWALMELAVFSMVEEIMFYYSHRQEAFISYTQTTSFRRRGFKCFFILW